MAVWQHEQVLILASKSQARQRLLAEAGLEYLAIPASINERDIQNRLDAFPVSQQAMELARAKALTVSKDYPTHWIIGSDQMLVCEDRVFHQVTDFNEAFQQLKSLQGRWHRLISSACLVHAGSVVAECEDKAGLLMKAMSDHAITDYLDRAGPTVFGSVGCYHIESEGCALFDAIEGQRSTIMGMPVEQLVEMMQKQGLIGQ